MYLKLGMLLVAASVTGQAHAYEFYHTEVTEQPLRWFVRDSLEIRTSIIGPEESTNEVVVALLAAALESWIGAPCGAAPEVTIAGTTDARQATTPKSIRVEPDNVLVFVRTTSDWTRLHNSPTWIAITKIAHNPKTGEIVDADIEINDGGYRFSYAGTPGAAEVDFLSMLTHEVGHFYGLDHSARTDATMFATYATSPDRAVAARTLSADDIAGICALYTDVPPHRPTGPSSDICGAAGDLPAPGLFALGLLSLRATRSRRRSYGAAK